MKAGQTLKVECPSRLAYGGQEVYGQFDSYRIREDTDLNYELTVLNCEHSIDDLNNKNKKNKSLKAVKVQKRKKVLTKNIIGSGEPVPDEKDRDNTGNH